MLFHFKLVKHPRFKAGGEEKITCLYLRTSGDSGGCLFDRHWTALKLRTTKKQLSSEVDSPAFKSRTSPPATASIKVKPKRSMSQLQSLHPEIQNEQMLV